MSAPYTGGCQCGSLRYLLTAEPVRVVACHCKECQRQSGSAFGLSMLVKRDSLSVTGPTKRFTRVADSGNPNTGVFCPECGVRIYHVPGYVQNMLVLKPGTLDDKAGPARLLCLDEERAGLGAGPGRRYRAAGTQRLNRSAGNVRLSYSPRTSRHRYLAAGWVRIACRFVARRGCRSAFHPGPVAARGWAHR
jgi:hypothetical protein